MEKLSKKKLVMRMKIKCNICSTVTNAVLTDNVFQYGHSDDIPIYVCESCGEYYIKLFSHGMRVIMQNGKFVPNGNLLMDTFVER